MKLETELKGFQKYVEPKLMKIMEKLVKRRDAKQPGSSEVAATFNEGYKAGLQVGIDYITGMIAGQMELREIHFGKKSQSVEDSNELGSTDARQ